jgi:hypothetical protein
MHAKAALGPPPDFERPAERGRALAHAKNALATARDWLRRGLAGVADLDRRPAAQSCLRAPAGAVSLHLVMASKARWSSSRLAAVKEPRPIHTRCRRWATSRHWPVARSCRLTSVGGAIDRKSATAHTSCQRLRLVAPSVQGVSL